MAKQKGITRMEGVVGDYNYYRSKDGYLVRENTSVDAARIFSDPHFARTRENMAEFGNAASAGKLFRNAINQLLKDAKDGRVVARLTKSTMEVLKTDAVNRRGSRMVGAGNVSLLKGFDFNNNGVLTTTFYAPYTKAINRSAGTLTVTIPAFIPEIKILAPLGATHFKLVSMGAEVDFTKGTFVSDQQESAVLPWDENATADISLVNTVTANSTLPLFLVFGIQFYEQTNGIQYPLKSGSFNPLSLIEVDGNIKQ